AVRGARRAHAPAHARLPARHLAAHRHDHRLRHARDRRGDRARRPHLRHVAGPALAHHAGPAGRARAAARAHRSAGGKPLQARRSAAGVRAAALFAGSLVIALALWQFLSTVVFNPFLIPPPLVVLQTAAPMAKSGEIFRHVAISLARVGVGFATGCAAAIVLGVILGRIQLVNELLDPIIELLRFLSPTAMIPIAVIWFGIGELSKYFLIFWGTFFIVLINTTAGVMRAPIVRQRA